MVCCTRPELTEVIVYCTERLYPQSPQQFACQPSARVSQTLRSNYLSHMIAAATLADECWHLHRPECRNTPIYAHTTSRTLPTSEIDLGSLTLTAPEAGEFVELILLQIILTIAK
jgi:hypothetical protein